MKTEETQSVEAEVMEAYWDCWNNIEATPWATVEQHRNLNFKASAPVTRDEAVRIMAKAAPGGYNEFDVKLLKLLPKGSMVTIAREGSPAVYVTPAIETPIVAMKADKWDTTDGVSRIWWD